MGKEQSTMLLWALFYAEEMGFSIIPIRQDKKPYVRWKEFQERRATRGEIEGWWRKWPAAMIGIVTGRISNLFVIDCDSRDGYDLIADYLPDSFTLPMAKTPRGGRHLYFTYENLQLTVGVKVLPDVDYRGEGGYVIAPRSVNDSGGIYIWFKDCRIEDIDLPALPDALNNLFIDIYIEGMHPLMPKSLNRPQMATKCLRMGEGMMTSFMLQIILPRAGCLKMK